MKSLLLTKTLLSKNNCQPAGFTLIELLVVTIIVGILAAVATPALIGNIAKARESEATSNLGILSRSQEAYHFEKQTFADTMQKLTSNVTITTSYYSFPDPTTATDILVQHQAVPLDAGNKFLVKSYASGIYYNPSASDFDIVICQGKGMNETVDAPNTSTGDCTNNGRKIK
jgi:type IV pilus assembly protein PilA